MRILSRCSDIIVANIHALLDNAENPDVMLAQIIREGDPRERTTYHAINAATRLLGKDVREKPVEEMDVESIRKKLLPLLDEK